MESRATLIDPVSAFPYVSSRESTAITAFVVCTRVRRRNSGTLSSLLNSDGVLGVARLEEIEILYSKHSAIRFSIKMKVRHSQHN
jgi:hypothetical protein